MGKQTQDCYVIEATGDIASLSRAIAELTARMYEQDRRRGCFAETKSFQRHPKVFEVGYTAGAAAVITWILAGRLSLGRYVRRRGR